MHWQFHMDLTARGLKLASRGDVEYTSAIDLWAMGIVAYQLLCGKLPFGLGEVR